MSSKNKADPSRFTAGLTGISAGRTNRIKLEEQCGIKFKILASSSSVGAQQHDAAAELELQQQQQLSWSCSSNFVAVRLTIITSDVMRRECCTAGR